MAIVRETQELRAEPQGAGTGVLAIPGERAKVLDQKNEWMKIRLPGGEEGWVTSRAVGDDAMSGGAAQGRHAIDREAFADACMAAAVRNGVDAHFLLATAELRSGMTDDADGDRVGPFRLTAAEWAQVTDAFAVNDIGNWHLQVRGFALMASRAQRRREAELDRAPTPAEIYCALWPETDPRAISERLTLAFDSTADLFEAARDRHTLTDEPTVRYSMSRPDRFEPEAFSLEAQASPPEPEAFPLEPEASPLEASPPGSDLLQTLLARRAQARIERIGPAQPAAATAAAAESGETAGTAAQAVEPYREIGPAAAEAASGEERGAIPSHFDLEDDLEDYAMRSEDRLRSEDIYETPPDHASLEPQLEPRRMMRRQRLFRGAIGVAEFLFLGVVAVGSAYLFRRQLYDAVVMPLFKLFGSMVPPAVSANSAEPSATAPAADEIELAAFAPPACEAGASILIQALLHLPEDQEAARELARQADAAATSKGRHTLSVTVRRGERLDVDLEAAGCTIDEPRQTAIWRGEPEAVQFLVTVPKTVTGSIALKITVARAGVPVGRLRFVVPVEEGATQRPIELRGDDAKRFVRAFISYASEDRVAVLKSVQIMQLAGLDVFQDVLSLSPGERWKKRLYSEIDRCDLFFLFWSEAARSSKWVVDEATYALRCYNDSHEERPDIKPVILEGPPLPKIPDSLKEINFNDKTRYIILGAETAAKAQAGPAQPN